MGYGVSYLNAVELRGRLASGAECRAAVLTIVDDVRATCNSTSTTVTTADVLYRAAAMTSMVQMTMIDDTDDRHEIRRRATGLSRQAATIAGDCRATSVETVWRPLSAWVYPSVSKPIGTAVIIGGLERWAMDFAEQARWLAAGGSRLGRSTDRGKAKAAFSHHHYMHTRWRARVDRARSRHAIGIGARLRWKQHRWDAGSRGGCGRAAYGRVLLERRPVDRRQHVRETRSPTSEGNE